MSCLALDQAEHSFTGAGVKGQLVEGGLAGPALPWSSPCVWFPTLPSRASGSFAPFPRGRGLGFITYVSQSL